MGDFFGGPPAPAPLLAPPPPAAKPDPDAVNKQKRKAAAGAVTQRGRQSTVLDTLGGSDLLGA